MYYVYDACEFERACRRARVHLLLIGIRLKKNRLVSHCSNAASCSYVCSCSNDNTIQKCIRFIGSHLLCASIIIIILHDSIFLGLNDLLNGFNGHKDGV